MQAACVEVLGLALCAPGSLLVMVACWLPMWKVSAFIDSNIVVAQTMWDGLWMSCVTQSTGQTQCKVHDSVLGLARDLQTARALTVLAAALGVVAYTVTVTGARCTTCVKDEAVKARVVRVGGLLHVLSALLVLVPLCWICSNIIRDFHDPHVPPGQKREMGASIYVGWAAAGLLLLGGALLSCSPRWARDQHRDNYHVPAGTSGDPDKCNYV